MWMRPEGPRRRRRMHARSNPKVPAEQQWDTEAQGPEHHGAYLERSQEVSQYSAAVDASQARQGGLATPSRRPVLAECECARGDACAAVRQTERHVNQLLHSGAGDLTANDDHAVASITQ